MGTSLLSSTSARIFASLALLALLFLGDPHAAFADQPSSNTSASNARIVPSWKPRLESIEGQLELLQSMTERHPGLANSNLQYRRNPFSSLAPVTSLVQKLGENAAPLEIGPTSVLGMQYTTGGDWTYDEKKIKEVRKALAEDLGKLELESLEGIENDLARLKASVREGSADRFQKKYPQQLGRLIRLAPWLYDSQGRPVRPDLSAPVREMISNEILAARPEELSGRHLSLFKEQKPAILSAAERLKDGAVKISLQSVENQFVERQVKPGVSPIGVEGGAVATRTILIEELSSSVAVFRGCKGGDCSLLSVPYYPLIKSAKTYWIQKNAELGAQPDGYLFVVEANVEGRKLPYIVTVNGVTLTEADVKKVAQLVAKDWGVSEVLLPDFSVNAHLVNTDQIRKGLNIEQSRPVRAQLPSGWKAVEEYQNRNSNGYPNYYTEEKLSSAKIAKIPPPGKEVIRWITPERAVRYGQPGNLAALSRVERAVLGANATENNRSAEVAQKVLRSLGITHDELQLGRVIVGTSKDNPLNAKRFEQLRQGLGYGLADLDNLDVLARAHSIGRIYSEKPELGSLGQWKELATRTSDEIDGHVPGAGDRVDGIRTLLTAKRQLPADLVPDRFENVAFYLNHPNAEIRSLALEVIGRADILSDSISRKILAMTPEKPAERDMMIRILARRDDIWTEPKYKAMFSEFLIRGNTYEFLRSERAPKILEGMRVLSQEERAVLLASAPWRQPGNLPVVKLLSELDTAAIKKVLPQLLERYSHSAFEELFLEELIGKGRIPPSDAAYKQILQAILDSDQTSAWLKPGNEGAVRKAIQAAGKLPPQDTASLMGRIWRSPMSAEAVRSLAALDDATLKAAIPDLVKGPEFKAAESLFLDELIGKGRVRPTDPEYKRILKSILDSGDTRRWLGGGNESAVSKALVAAGALPAEEALPLLMRAWDSDHSAEAAKALSALDTKTLKSVLPRLLQNYRHKGFESLMLNDLIANGRILPTDPEYKRILQAMLIGERVRSWLEKGNPEAIRFAIEAVGRLKPQERPDLLKIVRLSSRYQAAVSSALNGTSRSNLLKGCANLFGSLD